MRGLANVARLFDVCGRIDGRKKLQKMVHILQEAGYRSDFPEDFGYLLYGPYSSELKREIDTLVASGLVAERQRLGEYESYVYEATPQLGAELHDVAPPGEPSWAALARELAQRPAQELEAISTILFLRRCGVGADDLPRRFGELKPALNDRFERALAEASGIAK
jgi:uncharacterized protein